MQRKKLEAFSKIFKWLDSDKDGQISSMKIDISQIEPDLLEAISPVLIELEELNEPLDAEEFCDALGRLYDSVSLPTKEVLLLKRAKQQMPL